MVGEGFTLGRIGIRRILCVVTNGLIETMNTFLSGTGRQLTVRWFIYLLIRPTTSHSELAIQWFGLFSPYVNGQLTLVCAATNFF